MGLGETGTTRGQQRRVQKLQQGDLQINQMAKALVHMFCEKWYEWHLQTNTQSPASAASSLLSASKLIYANGTDLN